MSTKNILDKFLDGMEGMVGKLEDSKRYAGSEEADDTDEDNVLDGEIVETHKSKLIWGHADDAYHIFEGFSKSSICGSSFEAADITDRKTEMSGQKIVCCGICIRILQSRYQNA